MLTGRRCNPRSRVRSTSSELLLDPHRSTNHLEGAAPRCSQGSMARWRYQSKDSPEPDLCISVMQTRCVRTHTHTHCTQVHHLYHVRNCTLQLFTRGLRPLRTRVLLLCCGSGSKLAFVHRLRAAGSVGAVAGFFLSFSFARPHSRGVGSGVFLRQPAAGQAKMGTPST